MVISERGNSYGNINVLENVDNDDIKDGYFAIPNEVDIIGKRAFKGCEDLRTLRIGGHVCYIGESAFEDCDNLSDIFLSVNTEDFAAGVFDDCKNVQYITIESSNDIQRIPKDNLVEVLSSLRKRYAASSNSMEL